MPESSAGTLTAPPKPAKQKPGGTLYRGREGMWSWVLHRITGVAIFFFLLVHILDTALVRVSPEAYNAVIGTYQTPIMGLGVVYLIDTATMKLVDVDSATPGDQGFDVSANDNSPRRVVFTSGEHMETRGATNTLRLLQIGEDGRAEGLGEL